MRVEQITIFLENRAERLAEITSTLAENGINISALSLTDTADSSILRLIVNDINKAGEILKERGFTVEKTEVLVVEVPDQPGGLAGALSTVNNAKLNIEYMYAFSQRSGESGLIIFRFDDQEAAIKTFQEAGLRILNGEEVYAT